MAASEPLLTADQIAEKIVTLRDYDQNYTAVMIAINALGDATEVDAFADEDEARGLANQIRSVIAAEIQAAKTAEGHRAYDLGAEAMRTRAADHCMMNAAPGLAYDLRRLPLRTGGG